MKMAQKEFITQANNLDCVRMAGLFSSATVISFALILLLFASCSQSAKLPPPKRGPVPVLMGEATRTNIPVQISSIGHVSPYSTVAVRSQVDGILAKTHFTPGDTVKSNDLIIVIDPAPFAAVLKQVEAVLARDTALEKKAEIDARRSATLFNDGIESSDLHEQTLATLESLKATMLADQANVDTARLQLSYCEIRSPINGRTGDLLITPGNVVKKQDDVVLTINQIMPIYVDFSVPERELPRVRQYMSEASIPVTALAHGQTNEPSIGKLVLINNTVDTNTGNIFLRASFPNADERLWPGEFVDTMLTLTVRSNVVVVPSEAVQNSQNGESVFVVGADSTVKEQSVTTAEQVDGVTVITSGVKAGDKVVTSGQLSLVTGSQVQSSKAAAEKPESEAASQ